MLRARELRGARLPARLRDLSNPPERLFVVGELPPGPGVAIVGTRNPSREGAEYARSIARRLTELGVVVYSGGAKGIDTQAHLGALDAGGATVVVAPSSFDCPYPEQNASLFERVVRSGGAFLSPYRRATKAAHARFFARNSYLVALCYGLVVVESRYRGGARNAAKWARTLGRPVFAVPNAPWVPTSAGCLAELKLGARVFVSPLDVLVALREQNVHPFGSRTQTALPLSSAPPLLGEDPPAGAGTKETCGAPLPDGLFGATFSPPSVVAIESDAPALGSRSSRIAQGATRQAGCPTPTESEPVTIQGDFRSNKDRQRIMDALQLGPLHPDELCRTTGLSASRLQAMLLTLTLEEILVSHPSGYVIRVK